MLWMLLAGVVHAETPPAEDAPDAPIAGVVLTLSAYGEQLVGHVIVDATALATLDMHLWKGEPPRPRIGTQVPLVHNMKVTGTPKGDRIVQNAVDAMLYFDGNDDGYLDAADPAFASLFLFVDRNGDGKMAAGEIKPLGEYGVEMVSRFGDIRMKERWTKTEE